MSINVAIAFQANNYPTLHKENTNFVILDLRNNSDIDFQMTGQSTGHKVKISAPKGMSTFFLA